MISKKVELSAPTYYYLFSILAFRFDNLKSFQMTFGTGETAVYRKVTVSLDTMLLFVVISFIESGNVILTTESVFLPTRF